MKKLLIVTSLLTLVGCADYSAIRQQATYDRIACDNGQMSACIDLQNMYAEAREQEAEADYDYQERTNRIQNYMLMQRLR